MRVKLQTRILPDDYGIGTHPLTMEMVVSLQLGSKPPITFRHFTPSLGKESSSTLELPNQVASRLHDFCQQHYVNGEDRFDCRSLVSHAMNWRGGPTGNRAVMNLTLSEVGPTALQSGKPYTIFRQPGPLFPHFMLGISRSGFSLSVAGPDQPLVIAQNTDLLRAFKGSGIGEIKKVEYP